MKATMSCRRVQSQLYGPLAVSPSESLSTSVSSSKSVSSSSASVSTLASRIERPICWSSWKSSPNTTTMTTTMKDPMTTHTKTIGSRTRARTTSLILSLTLTLTFLIQESSAILPTAGIEMKYQPSQGSTEMASSQTLLASQAGFGTWPAMEAKNNRAMTPVLPPADDPLLCVDDTVINTYMDTSDENRFSDQDPVVLVVPRGGCTFERKALAAQKRGASAIVIYGTLASRYSLNFTDFADSSPTTADIVYPSEYNDYDCSKARALISTKDLSFDPLPYNALVNDAVLTGSAENGNLCAVNDERTPSGIVGKFSGRAFEDNCPSHRCLLTGHLLDEVGDRVTDDDVQPQPLPDAAKAPFMEACCAWDTFIWLYADESLHNDTNASANANDVTIPAFYITMEEASSLLTAMEYRPMGTLTLTLYRRYEPTYNISSILIWMLGIFVASIASYLSAGEYRAVRKAFLADGGYHRPHSYDMQSQNEHNTISSTRSRSPSKHSDQASSSSNHNTHSPPNHHDTNSHSTSYAKIASSIAAANANRPSSSPHPKPEESLELNISHALGFMLFSSLALLTLFFFKIYAIVKIMYALGCSTAIMQVLIHPLLHKLASLLSFQDKQALHTQLCDIGSITYIELSALLSSYAIGITWLAMALLQRHPETNTFFWITQDVMGACMCITFLSTIKINNIRVASTLLIIAFFYDIFFVFVTPLLTRGGKSIMVDVATSGGPPTADPSWCEKYPDSHGCTGGDPLPMLLAVPRFGDYQGGMSLLGLGDIVLPGLLLSFAARYDEAKLFIGALSGGSVGVIDSSSHMEDSSLSLPANCASGGGRRLGYGYFGPVVVAYAVGLAMANIAVYLMNMGQPALLYLVPCCLGTLCYLGWKRGEFWELWESPRVIRAADRILGGDDDDEEEEENGENGGVNPDGMENAFGQRDMDGHDYGHGHGHGRGGNLEGEDLNLTLDPMDATEDTATAASQNSKRQSSLHRGRTGSSRSGDALSGDGTLSETGEVGNVPLLRLT